MLGAGQMCAGGGAGDSCAGDSGSALMLELIPEGRQFDPRLVQVTPAPPAPPPPAPLSFPLTPAPFPLAPSSAYSE